MFTKFSNYNKYRYKIIKFNNNSFNRKDILRVEKYIFFETFIFISILISTLSISFILNSIKTIFDLYFINIIENCKYKQETRNCKYKKKY